MASNYPVIPAERIERSILVVRGHKIMLDADLAYLYGVSTGRLNEQVKRNRRRFPADFMFQLTADEARALRSQFATLKPGRGKHRKYLPYAFTEHGAVMHASVLNSPPSCGKAKKRTFCARRRIARCGARATGILPQSRPTLTASRGGDAMTWGAINSRMHR